MSATRPEADVARVLAWLRRHGTAACRDGMARYGITGGAPAFGVSVGALQRHAKSLGRQHDLALRLWDTGWYEARMLAVFLDEPALVTPAQMDRWARDFDSWAVCDTACMHLFDRTPHAWRKVHQWARRRGEFVKRAAFALVASLAIHDKRGPDAPFLAALDLCEAHAADPRPYVKKGVSWALRSIGRRGLELHAAALARARGLADSGDAAARWVGKDALRDLQRPSVVQRLEARAARRRRLP